MTEPLPIMIFCAIPLLIFYGLMKLFVREEDENLPKPRARTSVDADGLPTVDETFAGNPRRRHLFACYVGGNHAYPSQYCPYDEDTDEAREWIAGWHFAARGFLVEREEDRLADQVREI